MLSGSGLYSDKHGTGRGGGGSPRPPLFATNPTPPFEEPAFNLTPLPLLLYVNIVKSCKLLSTSEQRLEIYKIWPPAIALSVSLFRPTAKQREGGKAKPRVSRIAMFFCHYATKIEAFEEEGKKER